MTTFTDPSGDDLDIILEDNRLPEGAAKIRSKFTPPQRQAIKDTKPLSYSDTKDQKWKDIPRDIDVACMIAGVEKAGEGESIMQQFLFVVQAHWPDYGKVWLRNMRKAVVSILGEDKRLAEKGNKKNVVDQDGFDDLVMYGLRQLKEDGRTRPELFKYGTELAEIEKDDALDLVTIKQLDRLTFKARLNSYCPYRKAVGDNGYRSEPVPTEVANQIFAERSIPIPGLIGKASAPVFRPSGTLLDVPGYDEETKLFYAPPKSLEGLRVPHKVTDEDLRHAREMMVDLFCDFEMDGVSRAELEAAALRGEGEVPPSFLAAVGWLLEQPVRPILGSDPVMPMLVSKTAPGAGGSLIAKVMQIVVEGRTSSRPLAKSEDEIRKATFSALSGSASTLYYDNLPQGRALESDVLATLFTEPTFTDRVLGRSQERHLPMRASSVMVGNRPLLSDQLRRRFTLCELVPQHANPERRTGFKHPNLLRHVTKNRAAYVSAVLVLVRNWIQQGKPEPRNPPVVGSYETYSEVIAGILEAASPHWTTWGQNLAKLDEIAADEEEDEVNVLVDFWSEEFGVGAGCRIEVAELLASIERMQLSLPVKKKRTATSDCDYDGRSMAHFLSGFAGRIMQLSDGRNVKLVKYDKRGKAGNPWFLEEVQAREYSAPAPKKRRTRTPQPAAAGESREVRRRKIREVNAKDGDHASVGTNVAASFSATESPFAH